MSELKPCQTADVEDAIGYMKQMRLLCDTDDGFVPQVYDLAIDALRRAQPTNEPLTLEQLREMETPYPLWLENLPSGDMVKSYFQPVLFTGIRLRADKEERACWITSEASRANISVSRISSHGGVKFYRRPPERSENE